MKKETFIYNETGKEEVFTVGQKVNIIYYAEHGMEDQYKRKWYEELIDRPFGKGSSKNGIIVGDAGIHPYWLAGNKKVERYLLVQFEEYFFAKPIPISCIHDINWAIENLNGHLESGKGKIGQKGFEFVYYDKFLRELEVMKKFRDNEQPKIERKIGYRKFWNIALKLICLVTIPINAIIAVTHSNWLMFGVWVLLFGICLTWEGVVRFNIKLKI